MSRINRNGRIGLRLLSAIQLSAALACGGEKPTGPIIDPPPPAPDSALVSISGSVRDDYTGDPIQGATITAGGRTATSAHDGSFSLDGVPTPLISGQPASPLVSIQSSGFRPWSQPVPVPGRAGFANVDLFRTNALVDNDGFLIYLPAPTTPIRGVFVNLFNHTGGDSRPVIRGDVAYYDGNTSLPNVSNFRRKMMAFARTHGFALMGTQLTFADTVRESHGRVLETLKSLGTLSGRPELATAPLVIHGFGLGGCVAYGISESYPERVTGFIAEKMGLCLGDGAKAAEVPGYLIHGVGPGTVPGSLEHITSAFQRNRLRGAIWAFGIDHDAGHVLLSNHDLLFNWLSDVVTRRLPEPVPAGAPVILRSFDEAAGWVGDHDSFLIGPWACYAGNKLTASWLPTERTARDWQTLTSRGTTSAVISCGGP